MFKVLGEVANYDLDHATQSEHLAKREKRTKVSLETAGEGKAYQSFVVNTGHKGGLERHTIMTNGLLYIYNMKTDKLITLWRPSRNQLFRYYKQLKQRLPEFIIETASTNTKSNYAQGTMKMYKKEE